MINGDDEDRLAVLLAVLLALGGVLILRELLGLWATFAAGTVVAVSVWAVPYVVEAVDVRRLRRELERW